jgi:hypothetical protein
VDPLVVLPVAELAEAADPVTHKTNTTCNIPEIAIPENKLLKHNTV